MSQSFSTFVDFAKFNAQRHPEHDTFLVSRADNQWSWNTLVDKNIGKKDAEKIERSLLPKFAQATSGTFTSAQNLDEELDSSDEEDSEDAELELQALETGGLLVNAPEHDLIDLMFENAGARFDGVPEVEEGQKEVIDLMDFDNTIIFSSKPLQLDEIINDLSGVQFDRVSSPEFDPKTESLFTPGPSNRVTEDKVIYFTSDDQRPFDDQPSPFPVVQDKPNIFLTPKRPKARGKSPSRLDHNHPPLIPPPAGRPIRNAAKKPAIVELDSDDEPEDEDEDGFLYMSPAKNMASRGIITMPPLASPSFDLSKPHSSPPASVLVETSTLKQLGMKYNTKYHMIICLECQGGYGFGNFVTHAYTGVKAISIFDPAKHDYVQPKSLPRHSRPKLMRGSKVKKIGGLSAMTHDEIETAVLTELKALGHNPTPHYLRTSSKDARLNWVATAVPHEDEAGPIEGLRIYRHALRCQEGDCARDKFAFCGLTRDVIYKHLKVQHPTVVNKTAEIEEDVTVQTLCALNSWISYFEVKDRVKKSTAGSSAHVADDDVSLQDAVSIQQLELLGDLTADTGLDTDLIHPAFAAVGMVEFWKTFDFKAIQPLQNIVAAQGKRILQDEHIISQAATAIFLDIALHAKTANPAILNLITKGAALAHLPHRKKFTIPNMKTLKLYLVTEILLLRWLIFALENPMLNKKGEPIFQFDSAQSNALLALIHAARGGKSIQTVAAHVVDTLHTLYFPSNRDRAVFDTHVEPVNAFFAILCLTVEGAPCPLPWVPVYCARLQFDIRLHGYHYLFTTHAQLYAQPTSPAPHKQIAIEKAQRPTRTKGSSRKAAVKVQSSDSDYSPGASGSRPNPSVDAMALPMITREKSDTNWWQEKAIPWCADYLTEDEPTPYGHARNSMKEFSAAVRNHRKEPQVKWITPQLFLLDHHEIDLERFRSLLHHQLNNLEKFFCEKILFGYTLESLGVEVNFEALHDAGDITTLWHSPLLGDIRGNTDSEKFLKRLVTDGKLLTRKGADLIWDFTAADAWVEDTHHGTRQTHTVTHMTQGSGGRITEESKMLSANSRLSRRHLFVAPGLNTLCLFSNYWKGASRTGTFKEILRVIPFRVSRLIFILIRIIRPIILLYLLKHRLVADDRTETITKYRTALWATLGSSLTEKQMYGSIAEFLGSPDVDEVVPFPGFAFGARLLRQFVVAVQRKHITGVPQYTEISTEESIGDQQAGRSAKTGLQYYGVEESIIKKEPGFIAHYVDYSMKWHKYWKLSTEHGENDIYFV